MNEKKKFTPPELKTASEALYAPTQKAAKNPNAGRVIHYLPLPSMPGYCLPYFVNPEDQSNKFVTCYASAYKHPDTFGQYAELRPYEIQKDVKAYGPKENDPNAGKIHIGHVVRVFGLPAYTEKPATVELWIIDGKPTQTDDMPY